MLVKLTAEVVVLIEKLILFHDVRFPVVAMLCKREGIEGGGATGKNNRQGMTYLTVHYTSGVAVTACSCCLTLRRKGSVSVRES